MCSKPCECGGTTKITDRGNQQVRRCWHFTLGVTRARESARSARVAATHPMRLLPKFFISASVRPCAPACGLLCRTINLNSPNPLLFNTILTSNSIVFLPSPPNDFPTCSDFNRQMDLSPINHLQYSIVDLVHNIWLYPGAETSEILVANHSLIRYFI